MSVASHSSRKVLIQSLISPRHTTLLGYPSSRKFHVASTTGSPSPLSDDIRWPKVPNPTPYEILSLPPTASPTEIKKRYYELARKYHPDSRFGTAEAEQERLQRFRQVVQANELLSAARTRRIYDKEGSGWGSMDMNDIMGDPTHWKGNYEGRFHPAGNSRARRPDESFEGFFNGNNRAVPYYTSNANFAGGIIVIMVLAAVLQFSHVQKSTQRAVHERMTVHAQASLNLRDARSHARNTGRKDMIESFQQRRDVKSGIYSEDEIGNLISTRRR
jgi:curved DNA-binding protein CbpA